MATRRFLQQTEILVVGRARDLVYIPLLNRWILADCLARTFFFVVMPDALLLSSMCFFVHKLNVNGTSMVLE